MPQSVGVPCFVVCIPHIYQKKETVGYTLKKIDYLYAEISVGICMSMDVIALDLCHITEDKAERKIV